MGSACALQAKAVPKDVGAGGPTGPRAVPTALPWPSSLHRAKRPAPVASGGRHRHQQSVISWREPVVAVFEDVGCCRFGGYPRGAESLGQPLRCRAPQPPPDVLRRYGWGDCRDSGRRASARTEERPAMAVRRSTPQHIGRGGGPYSTRDSDQGLQHPARLTTHGTLPATGHWLLVTDHG